jgi:integrase/recombinase XerD
MKNYRMKKKNHVRDRALILLMLDTGLRISELARLKPEDINAESGEVLVAPAGSGQKTKPRVVYLGKNSKRAMWLWMAQRRDTEKLFGIDEKRIRALVHTIGYSAGVSNCYPHRFRHTFAIEFLRNGGDPFTLQRLLGHSTLDMVQHYLHIVEADKRVSHEKASPVDRWKLC